MSKHVVLTRKAAMTLGALHGFLKPRLAQDTKLDLTRLLGQVTTKNFGTMKPTILSGVKKAVTGKLAQDASVNGLAELLDALEQEKAMDDPLPLETSPNAGAPLRDKSMDAEGPDHGAHEQIKAFLKDKISPEDMAELEGMLGAEAADADPDDLPDFIKAKKADAKDADLEDEDDRATDEPADFKGKPEPITKDSMNRAIARAVDGARAAAAGVREAERFVRPWVGDLALAHDSAEGVYRTALVALGVKVKGVHPSAFKTILEHTPQPGKAAASTALGMDESSTADFAKRYPEAARIRFA